MRHLTPLITALTFAACGSSHTPDDCAGPAPTCLDGWSSSSECCLAGTDRAATCVGAAWTCPAGAFATSECDRIDAICEGPLPVDGGGPMDSGLVDCDAGPVGPCYRDFTGDGGCCLSGDMAPVQCDASGSVACPPGYRFDCARLDPVCEGVDAGGGPGLYDDCGLTSDCTLTTATCCGVCGEPSADDVAAVHMDRAGDYYTYVACPESQTGPVPCPDCPSALNPHLFATCDVSGFRPACAVVDFASDAFATCNVDSDCALATPSCCACGDIERFETIAIRADASSALHAAVCDDPTAICPPCVPFFDPALRAVCDAGRCVVQ